jgi:hypothetical protein
MMMTLTTAPHAVTATPALAARWVQQVLSAWHQGQLYLNTLCDYCLEGNVASSSKLGPFEHTPLVCKPCVSSYRKLL